MPVEARYNSIIRVSVTGSIFFLAMVICAGCGRSQGILFPQPDKNLYWPKAPEKSRIRYLGQLNSEEDLKREISFMEAFGHLIFGREQVGVLARPHALTMDDNDRLYIADSAGSVVHIMDFTTRQYIQFFEMKPQQRLVSPIGLVILDDKIYVADSVLRKVCVFDKKGHYKFSFGSDVLQRPSGIAYSSKQQKIYIADTKLNSISVFDVQGGYVGQLGSGNRNQPKFNFPTHLWVDKDDKLYVSDTLNYRIQVLSSEGDILLSFGRHGDRPGYFAHPSGLATDSFGNIYVSDKQFENVQIFNNKGQILMAFGNEGNEPGEFWLPAGIFIDNTNRIFVADSFNKRIQIFQLMEGQTP